MDSLPDRFLSDDEVESIQSDTAIDFRYQSAPGEVGLFAIPSTSGDEAHLIGFDELRRRWEHLETVDRDEDSVAWLAAVMEWILTVSIPRAPITKEMVEEWDEDWGGNRVFSLVARDEPCRGGGDHDHTYVYQVLVVLPSQGAYVSTHEVDSWWRFGGQISHPPDDGEIAELGEIIRHQRDRYCPDVVADEATSTTDADELVQEAA